MTNATRVLYIGVTSDLTRRVYEHKQKVADGFTKKYNVAWVVYYEITTDVEGAIAREKQLKGWRRNKKIQLVESFNPRWEDLSQRWYDNESKTP